MVDPKRRRGLWYIVCAGLLVLTVVGSVIYVQRDHFLVHYYARTALTDAEPNEAAEGWLRGKCTLSLPVLLSHLSDQREEVCVRAGAIIEKILEDYPDPTDPIHSQLSLSVVANLNTLYEQCSPPGRLQAVRLSFLVLRNNLSQWSPTVPTALETAGDVVLKGQSDDDLIVREQTLLSMAPVWSWDGCDGVVRSLVGEWKRQGYGRAVDNLKHPEPAIRSAAAASLVGAPFHEGDLQLTELLEDPDPGVQKAALVALAKAKADCFSAAQRRKLTLMLHDKDPEISAAASEILRNCGLSEAVIQLAKLMEDPVAAERAKVVSMVLSVPDIENPTAWLLELSKDQSPVVRLAVARAASTSDDADLLKRLEEMAQADPDSNVREISSALRRLQLARSKK